MKAMVIIMDEQRLLRFRKYTVIAFILVLLGAIVYTITQIPIALELGYEWSAAINAGINYFGIPLLFTFALMIIYIIRAKGIKK